MKQLELLHSQRVLRDLRDEVDSRLDRVVRSSVQGEGVATESGTHFSCPDSILEAVRCWPEMGWPDQLEKMCESN